jgi:hypothetical protein
MNRCRIYQHGRADVVNIIEEDEGGSPTVLEAPDAAIRISLSETFRSPKYGCKACGGRLVTDGYVFPTLRKRYRCLNCERQHTKGDNGYPWDKRPRLEMMVEGGG